MAYRTPEFDALVQKVLDQWNIPGLSLAVVRGGEIYAKSYGFADVSRQEKCTEDTIFNLASISKSNTAATVACLVDDNEKYPSVQWTTPVAQLIPDDFVLENPEYTGNITIEDMLSHRTGLPTHDNSYLGVRAEHPDNAATITRNLRNLEINKPLRTTFQYSNIMFTAATHLVEMLTKQPYPQFLRQRLWEPLGINAYHDLPATPDDPATKLIATPYRWDADAKKQVAISISPEPEGQGAGSIFCSAKEYAKWVRALLQRPSPPFSEETWKSFITPRTVMGEEEGDELPFYSPPLYALGLMVESYRGHKLIGHNGGVPGFSTMLRYMPNSDWGVVICANSSMAFYANETIAHVIMDDVLGVSASAPDKIDWRAFWTQREEKNKAEQKEDEDAEDLQVPKNPEPLGVELGSLVGTYFHAGYKRLVVQQNEAGHVVANCNDRCFPFSMTFRHQTGTKLVVDLHDLSEAENKTLKGEIRLRDGVIEQLGVALDEEVKDMLIWFHKVI